MGRAIGIFALYLSLGLLFLTLLLLLLLMLLLLILLLLLLLLLLKLQYHCVQFSFEIIFAPCIGKTKGRAEILQPVSGSANSEGVTGKIIRLF